jgi:hypothetical protein
MPGKLLWWYVCQNHIIALSDQAPRVSKLQATSRANNIRFHMPDGPAQQ